MAYKPKSVKVDSDDGGGDYWKRSTSALSNAFKYDDNAWIQEKIDAVSSVYNTTTKEQTKTMYARNLEILHNYTDFDFSTWRPPAIQKFLSKPKIILLIKNIPVQVLLHHIFLYGEEGNLKIGGVWFVAWLEGFKIDDLGIFSEALFRYLSLLYSKEYVIDPKYCLIIDIIEKGVVNYQQVLDGGIKPMLDSTIDLLNKFLS